MCKFNSTVKMDHGFHKGLSKHLKTGSPNLVIPKLLVVFFSKETILYLDDNHTNVHIH